MNKIINRIACIKLVAGLLFLLLSTDGFTQARAQADVSVTAVTITAARPIRSTPTREFSASKDQPGVRAPVVTENLKCNITVFSHNDDDANQTMLVVVVPVEVSVLSHPANATVFKAGGGTSPFAGYLVFNLGDMAVGQSITVEFTFTKSVYGNKVGAYAYSASPDPNPANNYKDATY
jgi:Domain of unknown function DUF11